MSTLEAEYIACSEGYDEAKWLLPLHQDIHRNDASQLPINCNKQGALSQITTVLRNARTIHINVSIHNCRDLHGCKIVENSYVHRNENVKHILTKVLTKTTHEIFTKAMGLWW